MPSKPCISLAKTQSNSKSAIMSNIDAKQWSTHKKYEKIWVWGGFWGPEVHAEKCRFTVIHGCFTLFHGSFTHQFFSFQPVLALHRLYQCCNVLIGIVPAPAPTKTRLVTWLGFKSPIHLQKLARSDPHVVPSPRTPWWASKRHAATDMVPGQVRSALVWILDDRLGDTTGIFITCLPWSSDHAAGRPCWKTSLEEDSAPSA